MVNTVNFGNQVLAYIKKGLEETIEAEYEKAKKELVERLEREKAVAIAGLTLNIMKMVDMQNLGERLVLTIRQEDKKNG